jgi:hypothetical protein
MCGLGSGAYRVRSRPEKVQSGRAAKQCRRALLERIGGYWTAETEALELVATERAHHPLLRGSLHAFSRGFHVEAPGHGEDRLDDGQMLAVASRGALNEALVDLDLREMGTAEIAE